MFLGSRSDLQSGDVRVWSLGCWEMQGVCCVHKSLRCLRRLPPPVPPGSPALSAPILLHIAEQGGLKYPSKEQAGNVRAPSVFLS